MIPVVLSLLVVSEVGKDFVIEARLKTSSGVFERYVSPKDERDFSVRLIRPDGTILELEAAPQKLFSSDERITRKVISESEDEVILESLGEREVLGVSRRIFEKVEDEICEATAQIGIPTPLGEAGDLLLSKLKCLKKIPQTENAELKVTGKENKSWVVCDPHFESRCLWNQEFSSEPEAAVQTSAFSFLALGSKRLSLFSIEPQPRGRLSAKSWSTKADKSSYDARNRSLNYGSGNYIDGLDGFVVVHEWGHSILDDLNPQAFGYEAAVIHEALSDFLAADTFASPCVAPYDAQEVPNRVCIRDLTTEKNYQHDLLGDSPHQDSLILSGALWKARHILPPGLPIEIAFEAFLRSPKDVNLRQFWKKFLDVYERLLSEREALTNKTSDLKYIANSHGL